ncbi:PaaI family thioesterase [Ramlibacter sp.]|uniref:PaaI family thioesterase n=1 Tax=Ramlibacter sp. TaxID=1917967 RepID=UPI002C35953C|nr:PaaI family thioesterase [Ramlibacter sp.]HWI82020.1 PaaI family thioesterase [Ramlibacter sp.]
MTEPASIPAGFRPVAIGGPFLAHNGPLYARLAGEGVQLGFRVEARHTNPLNICHGGMLATFADMLLPCVILYEPGHERRFLPTISLQVDYLAQAALGAWVQGEGQVLRRTRSMVFAQGVVSADGQAAMRVSGIFKLGNLIGDGAEGDPLRLRAAA